RAALAVPHVSGEEGLLANCRDRSRQLVEGLRAAGLPATVRGAGLLIGVAFDRPVAGAVVRSLMARGFLATEAGPGVVRISPALDVSAEQGAAFVDAFPGAAVHALEPEATEWSAPGSRPSPGRSVPSPCRAHP